MLLFRSGGQLFPINPEEGPWVFEEPLNGHLDPVDLDKYEIPEHLQVSNPKNPRGDDPKKGSSKMDDLSVKVSDIPKRTVTFQVSQEEAEQVVRYLSDCLHQSQNQNIRTIRAGFAAIAENRNFGGH